MQPQLIIYVNYALQGEPFAASKKTNCRIFSENMEFPINNQIKLFKGALALTQSGILINWWFVIKLCLSAGHQFVGNMHKSMYFFKNPRVKLIKTLNNLPKLFIHVFFNRITAKRAIFIQICFNILFRTCNLILGCCVIDIWIFMCPKLWKSSIFS